MCEHGIILRPEHQICVGINHSGCSVQFSLSLSLSQPGWKKGKLLEEDGVI
jgi:hypothetical protein